MILVELLCKYFNIYSSTSDPEYLVLDLTNRTALLLVSFLMKFDCTQKDLGMNLNCFLFLQLSTQLELRAEPFRMESAWQNSTCYDVDDGSISGFMVDATMITIQTDPLCSGKQPTFSIPAPSDRKRRNLRKQQCSWNLSISNQSPAISHLSHSLTLMPPIFLPLRLLPILPPLQILSLKKSNSVLSIVAVYPVLRPSFALVSTSTSHLLLCIITWFYSS